MSKGDFSVSADDVIETAPPDFCAMGQHSFEIGVSDEGTVIRTCNDCDLTEEVSADECIDRDGEVYPEHDYHFGVCRRCDAEEDGDEDA